MVRRSSATKMVRRLGFFRFSIFRHPILNRVNTILVSIGCLDHLSSASNEVVWSPDWVYCSGCHGLSWIVIVVFQERMMDMLVLWAFCLTKWETPQ